MYHSPSCYEMHPLCSVCDRRHLAGRITGKVKEKAKLARFELCRGGRRREKVPMESPQAAPLPKAVGRGSSSRGQVAVKPEEQQRGNSTENLL